MIDEMANRNFLSTVLSPGVDKNFFIKYGFYFRDNRYFFQIRNKNGKVNQFYHGSNFVLYPIAHITTGKESKNDSRRIYKMVNIFNHETTINLSTEEGIGLKSFMKVVESCGNFMFTGDENNLKELRESLNNETKTYLEIEQLGWQKRGSFWAYGNGIMDNNKFHPVDEYGLIEVANNKYYLPAFSKLNIDDDSLFLDQKRFIHSEREYKPTFKEITEMFINLYGENAKVIICAYLGVLFKDVIKRNEVKYPIINVFGEKGSGKTEFCSNAMFLFGQGIKEKKLDTATLPAIASYVGQFSNAFVHLDEYKNNIGGQKIEYLKGLWDGVGRTKANLEDISKTITSKVDCGILMSGQELCTVDNALLNRTCTITFFKGEFSDEERTLYKSFRDIARDGLTHITNNLLLLRENFIECFPNAMQQAMDDLSDMTNNCCETRLVQNWAILLASYKALEDVIDIDLQYDDLIAIFSKKLIEQNKISKSASEVNIFWEAVRICISRHQLRENFDYEVKMVNKVKVDDGLLTFPIPTRVLYLNPSKVFQLYAETQIASRESSIPTKSMKMYLENSSAFIGHKDSKRFKDDSKESGCCVTKAMVFNYQTLNVKLVDSGENNEDDYMDEKENDDTNNVQKVVENGLFDK
jgi:hypothetical protein